MANIVIPPNPGVTSALGLLMADPRRDYVTSRLRLVSELKASELSVLLDDLRLRADAEFTAEGYAPSQLNLEFAVDIRYLGQGYELTVPVGASSLIRDADLATLRRAFDDLHERSFGHSAPDEDAEAVNYRLRASALVTKATLRKHAPATTDLSTARVGQRDVCFDASVGVTPTPVYDRSLLGSGHAIVGPAIIEQVDSTTVVYPSQRAIVDAYMNLVVSETGRD
jgi:N-methylhydantoinase A